MIVQYESRRFSDRSRIWLGVYQNVRNRVHRHREAELIRVHEGTLTVGVNGATWEVTPGQAVLCPGGAIHYIQNRADSLASILIFDDTPVQFLTRGRELAQPLFRCDEVFDREFRGLGRELLDRPAFFEEAAIARLTSLLTGLYRREPLCPAGEGNRADWESLFAYIDGHYAEVGFADAAAVSGFSPSHFSRLFSEMTGMSFTDYRNSVRVEHAVEQLQAGGRTITEIAFSCGFGTIRHFNRLFRELTGFTPRELPPDFALGQYLMGAPVKGFDPTLTVSSLLLAADGPADNAVRARIGIPPQTE